MTQHIFLTGKKHIGKSTLIQKILDDYKKTDDEKLKEKELYEMYLKLKEKFE